MLESFLCWLYDRQYLTPEQRHEKRIKGDEMLAAFAANDHERFAKAVDEWNSFVFAYRAQRRKDATV